MPRFMVGDLELCRMKFLLKNHGIGALLVQLAVLWCGIDGVGAQQSPPGGFGSYPYSTFTPSMAIIIVILVAALFFMVFFSIYIRRCSDAGGGTGGSLRRALSRRNAAAARGLDPSVVETFPTFSYAEVKDHKIGKGALECAVCLNEFGEDETLRLLPKCDHVFHPECIDAWLAAHVTCPVCRANLVPQHAEEATAAQDTAGDDMDCGSARNGEIAVQVDGNDPPWLHRNPSLELPAGPARSWSIRGAKVFGLGKFRSHSTGHSLVQPGENLDRFTLRLPEGVRKEVINRASLNRTMSCVAAAALPREGSSRRGYRAGGAEGSSRGGGFYRRLDRADRGMSDQWGFLTRGFSMRSTKVVAESGSGDGSKRTPSKMPSFRWLEPKAADQTSLFKEGPSQSQSPV